VIDEAWFHRPDGVPESIAAGGIVARRDGARILIALAQERILDDYVLPKGHVDPGETIEQAAAREIEEEVGISDLTLVESLGTKERLSYDKTEWKTTHYFLYTTEQIEATPTDGDQHDAMAWFPLDELPDVFWPEQRELIRESRGRIRSALT
jgi:8-oxo-dGTP pyrophosphatase MutT (NUDIX family)